MNTFDAKDKVIAITGAGAGIGRALAERFAQDGARHLALADRDARAVGEVAARLGGTAWEVDVASESAVARFVSNVSVEQGDIDLYCSNAGILTLDEPDWTVYARSTHDWQSAWEINVMSHVHACRAVLPAMIDRGQGAVLITASAAGLLTQVGAATYSTTKHAALGFAESLAITHGDDGIYVGVLCPQGVSTDMLKGLEDGTAAMDGAMDADVLAKYASAAMARGEFMIRPHEQVAEYFEFKASSYDRWIGGMRKLRRSQREKTGRPV